MNDTLVTRLLEACKERILKLDDGETCLMLGDLGPHDMVQFAKRWPEEVSGSTIQSERLDCGKWHYDQADLVLWKDKEQRCIRVFTPLAYAEVFHPDIYRALARVQMIEQNIPFVQRAPEVTLVERIIEAASQDAPLIVADITERQGYDFMDDKRFKEHGFSVGRGSGSPSLPDNFHLTLYPLKSSPQRQTVDIQTLRCFVEERSEIWRPLVRIAMLDAAHKGILYVGNKKVVVAGSNDVVVRSA